MMKRRDFIKNSVLTSGAIISNGILSQKSSAAWNAITYESGTADIAIQRKFNKGTVFAKAKNIKFKVPRVAQNRLIVPITVDARKRKDVKSIAIVIDGNPQPMAAFVSFIKDTEAFLSIRVKMAKTSKIRAILDTDSGLEEISQHIKVTIS